MEQSLVRIHSKIYDVLGNDTKLINCGFTTKDNDYIGLCDCTEEDFMEREFNSINGD